MMKKISWISYFLYSAVILIITAGASYALDSETPETALPDNGLPVVVIEIDETEGHTIKDMNNSSDHSVKCYGSMSIIVPDGFRYCDLDIAPESLGPVPLDYIRGRGNSTWKAEKKPYRIKLENKTDVFGLGTNKHWVLLANAFDTTTFKNRFVGWLGDEHYVGIGNAHLVSPPRDLEAWGDRVDYYGKDTGKAIMTGHAWAVQDNNTLRGNKLTLYMAKDGSPKAQQ